jgi:hypothetical protein
MRDLISIALIRLQKRAAEASEAVAHDLLSAPSTSSLGGTAAVMLFLLYLYFVLWRHLGYSRK